MDTQSLNGKRKYSYSQFKREARLHQWAYREQVLKVGYERPQTLKCVDIKVSDILCVEQTLWSYPHSIASRRKRLLAGEL